MPLYEYKCREGHGFEALRAFSQQGNAPCPSCGNPGMLQVSMPAPFLMAEPYNVYNSDGRQVSSKQQTDWAPMQYEEGKNL